MTAWCKGDTQCVPVPLMDHIFPLLPPACMLQPTTIAKAGIQWFCKRWSTTDSGELSLYWSLSHHISMSITSLCFPFTLQLLRCVCWPGSTHDARVLTNSPLYRKEEDQGGYHFPPDVSKDVNGVEVPAHLVGDLAYPLRNWLMKGFTQHQGLDLDQQRFNKALNSARIVVEHAYCRLNGCRWCLSNHLDISTTLVPGVVFARCVLHNICEINKEDFLSEWTLVEADGPAPISTDCHNQQAHGHQAIHSAILSIL
ncbi:uncharacterized protein [Narcine bancroftii]|uniref:uncharacterized protein n=1 Tax=Narcine bancroftii TaxID=1343680 RepID=UPI0038310C04